MLVFKVDGMSCNHCVNAVTQAVKTVDPQAQVEVDLPNKQVVVQTREDRDTVAAALTEAGYPPN